MKDMAKQQKKDALKMRKKEIEFMDKQFKLKKKMFEVQKKCGFERINPEWSFEQDKNFIKFNNEYNIIEREKELYAEKFKIDNFKSSVMELEAEMR